MGVSVSPPVYIAILVVICVELFSVNAAVLINFSIGDFVSWSCLVVVYVLPVCTK